MRTQRLIRFSVTGALVNNFVDAQFLQAAWPHELDDVRLLIITVVHSRIATHDWNLFTPKANAQAIIDSGVPWSGRDIILKLENGHFTILKARIPSSDAYREHPIQDLLDMIGESKVSEAPGERQLLHLESIFGGNPDPTRPMSILDLHRCVVQSTCCASNSEASETFESAGPIAAHGPAHISVSEDNGESPQPAAQSSPHHIEAAGV
jgi:hypothetical protein